jgi:archaemetzincin
MKKRNVGRIGLILAAVAVWAGILYAFVVKPVRKASQADACADCPVPRRTPGPESDEGYDRLGPPKPGQWRSRFQEAPQSFEAYVAGPVNFSCAHRTTFYILPLGGAAARYREMLERMRAHSEAYFGVPAKLLDPAPMFEEALHAERGQYDSSRIIDLLSRRVPRDALVYIGITNKDLFSPGLNFVFGEASLQLRCGIYSLTRYETEDLPLFTRRALKLVSHESGHILSIEHCVTYSCVMQGANSLEEDDGHPMHLCPIDLRKVLWNTGVDRNERYRRLEALYRQWGCKNEADWVSKKAGP